jgi:DNA replication initiation complex subunit (GINS family)
MWVLEDILNLWYNRLKKNSRGAGLVEEKLFKLMEKMYNDLSAKIDGLKKDIDSRFDEVDIEVQDILSEIEVQNLKLKQIKQHLTKNNL